MLNLPSEYRTTTLKDGTVSLDTRAFPHEALGEQTVVIRPDYIGICRADTKEIYGSRDVPEDRGPLFGHELVGTVSSAGAATGFREGETVTFNPNITPTRTTGFAEYIFVHGTAEQLEQAVVRVPEAGIRSNIWMPEPFSCIVHALKKLLELADLDSLRGKRVAVIGAGCAGLMFAMYARHLGADMTVFNRNEDRRSFAREQGILAETEIYALADVEEFRDGFDVVIIAPTIVSTDILKTSAAIAADGGILFVYGGTRAGDTFPPSKADIDTIRRQELSESVTHLGKQLDISGAYGCYREDYEEGFRLRAEYPEAFPLQKLTSRLISLEDFPELVTDIAAGKKDLPGKVLIEMPSAKRYISKA
ncbi:MDR/zinc-dependent alcohol dehydrogenase-like family protein [Streptomyces violascens]|uniref:2-deoxy-scyllo-inosamine dehydrogenase n=1 Tax=Streptomyces violascens TaxID=67381 RepID=A0ABQ3R2C7_9ACTN|nr:medium chain dehydrogenase/reductase family protein [Streptomyces violascens]GGU32495.1 alcohol dehydrogenase [Streptomyces violascens]GHI43650.1 alcohol dehydrogenase [Streptomyces violascens]